VAAGELERGGVDPPVPEHATISKSDAAVGTMVARRTKFIASSPQGFRSFPSLGPRFRYGSVRSAIDEPAMLTGNSF